MLRRLQGKNVLHFIRFSILLDFHFIRFSKVEIAADVSYNHFLAKRAST